MIRLNPLGSMINRSIIYNSLRVIQEFVPLKPTWQSRYKKQNQNVEKKKTHVLSKKKKMRNMISFSPNRVEKIERNPSKIYENTKPIN